MHVHVHEPKTCARGLFLIVGCILEIGHGKTKYSLTIYLTTTKSERANAHRSQKRTCAAVFSRARLFSHSNMHCRDYAWKDKILNDHLSNNNKKIQPHRGVRVRTRAENIHVPLFSLSHGRFLIVKCILETCHKQKKYSLKIYLIVGCVLSKLSQGFFMYLFYANLI